MTTFLAGTSFITVYGTCIQTCLGSHVIKHLFSGFVSIHGSLVAEYHQNIVSCGSKCFHSRVDIRKELLPLKWYLFRCKTFRAKELCS